MIRKLKKILMIALMMLMALSIIGCSSKLNSADAIRKLKPTDRVEVEFVKTDDKFCAGGNDVLRISHVISNLRYNQWILIRALRGETNERE